MEPTLRSAQVLKQEAEDIGFEGKDILEYVKEQQKLDREERAAWREAQKMQAQADVELAKIRAEAEEKRRADEIKVQMAKIEAEKELTLREMELKAQDQASASLATTPPPRNKDAKSPKLPSFIDEKDELDSYLLRFERYAENASWEKDTWAIKLSALLTGRAMDVYTRMSDADASDYDKLKKALLTRYNYTEDGYRKRFREATPETEETPDQFVIRLKNYLAKWLELSGSSPQNFDALVDLIVKEQFINACSEDLAMYLLERGPKDLVEFTTWAQKYLIAHKEQLGKSKATVQPRRVDQKKTTESKPDSSQGRQRLLQCYRCRGFGHRQSECGTKISPGKEQKGSSTPVSQSSQKKTRAMVAQLDEDGEKAFTCVEVEGTRSRRNSKKSGTEGSTNSDRAVYSAVCRAQSNDGSNRVCVDFRKLNKITEVDPEPMKTAEDLFRRLSGKKYLSKIDLTKGYWQIPVAPEDVHKTAFVTPDGQYEFTRMPFGMVNSGATLVRGLGMPGVGSYIDDIVIYSDSWEDHIKTLKELFSRLRKARITARPTKCLLGASRMEFLGHQVGGDVITPSRDNLEKVRNTPRPTTKKQVRSFLGLVGYYRDHIPAFAEISAPLTDLLK